MKLIPTPKSIKIYEDYLVYESIHLTSEIADKRLLMAARKLPLSSNGIDLEILYKNEESLYYEIKIKTSRAGVHNFAFRIYPKHPLMQHRMELPLIKWV